MKSFGTRFCSILLSIILLLGVLPIQAFAAFDVEGTLLLDEEKTVKSGCYYKFVPSDTRTYLFESYGESDTLIELYDSNKFFIGRDDQGGEASNFGLTTELTANKTYYVKIFIYEPEEEVSTVSMKVTESEQVSDDDSDEELYEIQSLNIDDLVLYQGVNSSLSSKGYEEYSLYEFLVTGKVTLADGKVLDIEYGIFEDDDVYGILEFADGQSEQHVWTVGNTYPVTATYHGVSDTFMVTIKENPIQDILIDTPKIHIGEDDFALSDIDVEILFRDGSKKTLGKDQELQFDNGTYQVLSYDFSAEEVLQWEPGKYSVTASFCGMEKDFQIEIEDHDYKYVVTTRATTSKNGKMVPTCRVCNKKSSTKTIYYAKRVELSTTSYTYNGYTKKPSVKVYDSAGKVISSEYYSVSYSSGRKYVGKYYVKVTFKGRYSGSRTAYFYIKPRVPEITKIKSATKAFTVYWQISTSQTSGFQIKYDTSSSFKNARTRTISSYRTRSSKFSGMRAKRTYYVKIRTYKRVNGTKYYSSWSETKTVKTR